MPAGRNHSPFTNVHHVHHADHEVVARASALLFLVESGDQILAHVGPKIGWVQRNDLGLFFEEEHCGGGLLDRAQCVGEVGGQLRRDDATG